MKHMKLYEVSDQQFHCHSTQLRAVAYRVFIVFVAILTVNLEFFVNIAAASFDVFSATLTAWRLVVSVYAFLFVAKAGAIIGTWILCHTPGVY